MTDTVLKLLSFAAVAVFLGILIAHVPRLDLGAVIALTLAATAWDFFAPTSKS